jgi:hypothetical protein
MGSAREAGETIFEGAFALRGMDVGPAARNALIRST